MNGTLRNLLIFFEPGICANGFACCVAHFWFRNITEQHEPAVVFAFNISAFSSNVKF